MTSTKSVGRTIGVALLVQVLLAPPVYFRWMRPGTAPDFLENAAGNATAIRIALVLTFLLGMMTFTVALAALPIVRRHSDRMAFAFVALSVVGLSTLAAETIAARNMLSLSLEYAKAGAPSDLLQTLGGLARSTWLSSHYTNLMFAHGTVFFLFVILYRFALVPRPLAALGLGASALSTTVVTSPLLGYPLPFRLIIPMALTNAVLILWLMVRGLEQREPLAPAAAPTIA